MIGRSRSYSFCDLRVESDLPLPELPRAADSGAACRLRSRRPGPAPRIDHWDHHWRSPTGRVPVASVRREGSYRLRFPGLADFVLGREGDQCDCFPFPETPPATLRHLVVDQVLPRLRSLRRGLVLHAAAVASPLGVCLFLGPSGSGKSTLCASLAGQGLAPLADDCVLVRRTTAATVVATPGCPGVRLSPEALRRLYGSPLAGSPVSHASDKRRVTTRPRAGFFAGNSSPVIRAYLLDPPAGPGRVTRVRISRVSRRDVATALIGNSFQLDVTHRERIAHLLDEAVELAAVLSARRLEYPRRFDLLSIVRDELMSDLG